MGTADSGTQTLRHSGTAFADLHLHTTHSDGTFPPPRLVEEAIACGLSCIAVTDHDTVNGIAETAALAQAAGIEFIPGIELTAAVDEREFHVLGYFPNSDGWNDPAFRAEIKKFADARVARVHKIVTNLNAVGVPIRADDIFALSGTGTPGRLHVARALQNGGFADSVDGAFIRYLRKGQPGFAPKFRISAQEAIALVHRFQGVAVFAHPGIAGLDHRIPDFIRWGLDGIEVWHSKHRPSDEKRYGAIAEQNHLLMTGGSDCHGLAKDEVLIGSVRLPYEYVQRLKEHGKKPRMPQRNANQVP